METLNPCLRLLAGRQVLRISSKGLKVGNVYHIGRDFSRMGGKGILNASESKATGNSRADHFSID